MTDQAPDLKKHFDHSCRLSKNTARCRTARYIESHQLDRLSRDEKIRKLYELLQMLLLEADALKRKDYLIFAHSDLCLFNLFSGHLLLDQCNEKPHLQEGLFLFEKIKCVIELLNLEKRKVPGLNYGEFIEGKYNVLFYELHERPAGTSPKDYHKMRCWQIQKMWQCANLDFDTIRSKFIERVKDSPLLMDVVSSNIQLVDDVFENCKTFTASQLYVRLSGLTGLLPGSLPDEVEEFYRLFCLFDPQKSVSHSLSPRMIKQAGERIRNGKISNAPICCWSLLRFKRWLVDILQRKIELNDPPAMIVNFWWLNALRSRISTAKRQLMHLHTAIHRSGFHAKATSRFFLMS